MEKDKKIIAREEIHETLIPCDAVISKIGLSFIDDSSNSLRGKFKNYFRLAIATALLFTMLMGEFAFTASLVATHVSLEELIGSYLHIAGYDTMSFGKLLTIWYQKNAFKRLVEELRDLWPVGETDPELAEIKRSSLSTLKFVQYFYSFNTYAGVWAYNLTPIAMYLYYRMKGEPAEIGLIWHIYYPFSTTKTFNHVFVYIFETCAGLSSVYSMIGADLLFITMANHITMLLRLLQVKVRNLGKIKEKRFANHNNQYQDCYKEIVELVKIHQRLISYGNDLEDAFSAVNLINLLLSSVNLCCALFNIVFLNPWEEIHDKFFTIVTLAQMGMICWYADDIFRASAGVADAAYESGWYDCNVKSRQALLVLLQRSQRPLYFTALKFKNITMMTYGSFLTTSYSYFTLLYTSYSRKIEDPNHV